MWQRAQKPSRSEPGRDSVWRPEPRSKLELHCPSFANGLWRARSVASGGGGTPQSPFVEVSRAESRNAPRHTGSRQAFAIIEPFHSSKIRLWHDWHCPGLSTVFQYSSNGGAKNWASSVR